MDRAVWPLTARAAELSQIESARADANTRALVVAGPAGVGKSRIAAEVARRAQDAGSQVAAVLATEAAALIPLAAFASVLAPDEISAAPSLSEIMRAAERRLRPESDEPPGLLLVDDAHLLDPTGAALVLHLARSGAAFVLVTIRSGEPCADAITALWKEDGGARLDLAPLSHDQIVEVLEAGLDGPVSPLAAHELAERSHGNLLFLTELVRGSIDRGTLVCDRDGWRLTGALAPSEPLSDLVRRRLQDLGEDERRVVELVALAEPLDLATVERAVGATLPDELESRGHLRVTSGGGRQELRLSHPLHGEILREALPPLRARALLRQLVDALSAGPARRAEDILRLASWRLQLGQEVAPELLVTAARVARSRFALDLTERLAHTALRADPRNLAAGMIAGEAAISLGRGEAAETLFASLQPLAQTDLDIAQLAMLRMANRCLWIGGQAQAVELGNAALAQLTEPAAVAEIHGAIAGCHYTMGNFAAAEQECDQAALTGIELPLHTITILAYTYATSGRLTDALTWAERSRRRHRGRREYMPAPFFALAIGDWFAMAHVGRAAEAVAEFDERFALAVGEGTGIGQAWTALGADRVLQVTGEVAAGERWARLGLDVLPPESTQTIAKHLHIDLAYHLALLGRPDEAREHLERASAMLPWSSGREMDRLGALAWILTTEGDLEAARRQFVQAIECSIDAGAWTVALAQSHDLARIGFPHDAHALASTAAAKVDGPLAAARVAHVAALQRQDIRELDSLCARFEASGALLIAAECAAEVAVLHTRAGDSRAAAAAGRRSDVLAARCGEPRTPARGRITARAELSPAEQRIAALAAAGHPNREIADRLILSVRTVENTLRRVYLKLGIKARGELPDAL